MIFLAELGDKTQLLLIGLSARSRAPHMVFLGAVAALIVSSLIAVLAGESVLKAIPVRTIQFGTGVAFLAIGVTMLYRAMNQA